MRRVVVTGAGAVSPCGPTMAATWDALIHGRSGIRAIESFEVSDMRCKVAGQCRDFEPSRYFDKSTLRHSSRFIHLGVAAAQMAVDQAGIDFGQQDCSRVGVLLRRPSSASTRARRDCSCRRPTSRRRWGRWCSGQ